MAKKIAKNTRKKPTNIESPASIIDDLLPGAEGYYRTIVNDQKEVGYYNDSDEMIRVLLANEWLQLCQLQATIKSSTDLIQVAESGYEQKSVRAQLIQTHKTNIDKLTKEAMLTPYQRKKGDTAGKHKSDDPIKLSIEDAIRKIQ